MGLLWGRTSLLRLVLPHPRRGQAERPLRYFGGSFSGFNFLLPDFILGRISLCYFFLLFLFFPLAAEAHWPSVHPSAAQVVHHLVTLLLLWGFGRNFPSNRGGLLLPRDVVLRNLRTFSFLRGGDCGQCFRGHGRFLFALLTTIISRGHLRLLFLALERHRPCVHPGAAQIVLQLVALSDLILTFVHG